MLHKKKSTGMKVAVAAGGRFHALHLAHQLECHGALAALFTASFRPSDKKYVTSGVHGVLRLQLVEDLIMRFRLLKLIDKSRWYVWKDNWFDRWLARQISQLGHVDIFVGWAHYILHSIPAIRSTGAKIVLESGSCHILEQEKLLCEEYAHFGLKSAPIHPRNRDKMLREYEQADYIMTPSRFVYDSFLRQGVPAAKLLQVPYGVDAARFYVPRAELAHKFRVLFVGQLSLQKGVSYLLDAWQSLNLPHSEAELVLVGNIDPALARLLAKKKLPVNIIFHGSVPQEALNEQYARASLFVLPSIQEGLAMVQAEAMAAGLPLLATTNTGAAELIDDGREGFIVPIRNAAALAEKIAWSFQHRDVCFAMGMRAQEKIKQFSWDCYGDKIMQTYQRILEQA